MIFRHRYFLLTVLVGGFFLWLTLWFGLGTDQSIFIYGAWVWRHFHEPPYVGVWDPNFPGIFIIHLLVMRLFGESILAYRFFDFIAQMLSMGMIYQLTRKVSGSERAGFLSGVLFAIFYFGGVLTDTAQREGFIMCLELIALTLSFRLEKRVWTRAVIAGLLLGFAFLLKPPHGLAWLVFGIWFLAEGIKGGRKSVWLEVMVFAFFCLLPALLVILYYWRMGCVRELYLATIWYNFAVYRHTPNVIFALMPWWMALLTVSNQIFMQAPLIFLFALLALFAGRPQVQTNEQRRLLLMILAMSMVGLLSYLSFRKYFPYHLLPFWGFVSIPAGWGCQAMAEIFRDKIARSWKRLGQGIFYAGVISLMVVSLNPEQPIFAVQHAFRSLSSAYLDENGYYSDPHKTIDQHLAANRLRAMLAPGDRIEFFGSCPLIPFLLKQKLSSRFCAMQFLLASPPGKEMTEQQRRWFDEYSKAVMHEPPRFFVIQDFIPGYLGMNFPSEHLKDFLPAYFPELDRFLRQNYKLVSRVGSIEIYERV
jgi:4-amino-4-deoxy-L-arabinose transferase-like glycosyltransferase